MNSIKTIEINILFAKNQPEEIINFVYIYYLAFHRFVVLFGRWRKNRREQHVHNC